MTPLRNTMLREHYLADYLEELKPDIVVNNWISYTTVLSDPVTYPKANVEWLKIMVKAIDELFDQYPDYFHESFT